MKFAKHRPAALLMRSASWTACGNVSYSNVFCSTSDDIGCPCCNLYLGLIREKMSRRGVVDDDNAKINGRSFGINLNEIKTAEPWPCFDFNT